MTALLMTGFPGFLGSALLPRLLARDPDARAVCLVQPQHRGDAEQRLAALEAEHGAMAARVDLVPGDLTEPGLGLSDPDRELAGVTEVWNLAAVYDLTVEASLAERVNVAGTRHLLDVVDRLPDLQRLHHVSTCYVSGRWPGRFAENDLVVGQQFQNHYERTKFLSEVVVRDRMLAGLPATVYRPGVVVGDSVTGATQKFDGPYFLIRFLQRQARLAIVPRLVDPDSVHFSLVPRDFVIDAMEQLSGSPASLGRTYALTDPQPPTVRELVDTFARLLDRRVVWTPVPGRLVVNALGHLPILERLIGVPAETLPYFAHPTDYDTTQTTQDLAGTGVVCPHFEEYAHRMVEFVRAHPEIGSAAMV